uniref:ARAD1A15004p n=1 Tax=Blastobotrys adeninivorans TaxID=409370 RepID=A0A060SXU3_BLAAD
MARLLGSIWTREPKEATMTDTDLRTARLNARNALQRAGALSFKPVSSAKWVDIERTWTGKLHVRIEHDKVNNCTPGMIRWWFENLGRSTNWDGVGLVIDITIQSFHNLAIENRCLCVFR